MTSSVYLLGGARTDFKRNLKKEGKTLRDVIVEVARAALRRTGLHAADIQAGIVGNFAGGLFTRQLHVGALLLEADDALRGIPTMHVEAACASGSLAVLTAAQWIAAGLHDCVLVVGAEQQKTMSPADGSDVLAAAADYDLEKPAYGDFMFPKLFGRIAEIYMQRYPSLTEHDLARVAVKNYLHAHLNPLAQMRDTDLDFATPAPRRKKIGASPPARSSSTTAPRSPTARRPWCCVRNVSWTSSATAPRRPVRPPPPCRCSAGDIPRTASRWKRRTCRISRRRAAP